MDTVQPDRDDLERLGETDAFRAQLERLAAVALEPWASRLREIERAVAETTQQDDQ